MRGSRRVKTEARPDGFSRALCRPPVSLFDVGPWVAEFPFAHVGSAQGH